jgi:hypothetical protein
MQVICMYPQKGRNQVSTNTPLLLLLGIYPRLATFIRLFIAHYYTALRGNYEIAASALSSQTKTSLPALFSKNCLNLCRRYQ